MSVTTACIGISMHERTAQGPWPSAADHAFEKCVLCLCLSLTPIVPTFTLVSGASDDP